MLAMWRSLPAPVRQGVGLVVKAGLTVGAFYLLLAHSFDDGAGGRVTVWSAIQEHVTRLDVGDLLPFVLAAAGIKMVGIVASMVRWQLLLLGQGIRFNFWHIVGSFLIGR